MSILWNRIAMLGVSGFAMAAATQAHAQQAASEDTRSGPVLEEIVVTSDRPDSYGADFVQAGSFRGARQLDTPLTVNVISEQLLKSQQAQSVLDALRNSPGVTSSQTSPTVYNNLSIRGIPVENRGNYRLNGSLPIVNLTGVVLAPDGRSFASMNALTYDMMLLRIDTLDELKAWIAEHRYVRDFTCEERAQYTIPPLCEEDAR